MPVLGTHLDGRCIKVNTHRCYHWELSQHFSQETITKHCATGLWQREDTEHRSREPCAGWGKGSTKKGPQKNARFGLKAEELADCHSVYGWRDTVGGAGGKGHQQGTTGRRPRHIQRSPRTHWRKDRWSRCRKETNTWARRPLPASTVV